MNIRIGPILYISLYRNCCNRCHCFAFLEQVLNIEQTVSGRFTYQGVPNLSINLRLNNFVNVEFLTGWNLVSFCFLGPILISAFNYNRDLLSQATMCIQLFLTQASHLRGNECQQWVNAMTRYIRNCSDKNFADNITLPLTMLFYNREGQYRNVYQELGFFPTC